MSASLWADETKAGLEGGGGEIDAAFEHGVEEGAEPRLVAGRGAGEVGHSVRFGEEDTEHAAGAVGDERDLVARACSVRPDTSFSVLAPSSWKKPGSEISSRVLSPAAMATGLPDRVPAW